MPLRSPLESVVAQGVMMIRAKSFRVNKKMERENLKGNQSKELFFGDLPVTPCKI